MSKPYNPVPFTNKLGQVIQPGDKVLIFAKGYCHNIKFYQGVYLGSRGEGRDLRTVCLTTRQKYGYFNAKNQPCKWHDPGAQGKYVTREYQTTYFSNWIFKLI